MPLFINNLSSLTGENPKITSSANQNIDIDFSKIFHENQKTSYDPQLVTSFCKKMNSDLTTIRSGLSLLVKKMQSHEEWEALLALSVLDAAVNECGCLLHQEIGKFKFLNEIIRMISPKFLGNRTTAKVQTKCIELLYSWTIYLPHESKISEAYNALKNYSFIKSDPTHILENNKIVPRPRSPSIFDNHNPDVQTLKSYLKSKNENDLQKANNLIKQMLKKDDAKVEVRATKLSDIEKTKLSARILNEMLDNYANESESSEETLQIVYDDLKGKNEELKKMITDCDTSDSDLMKSLLDCNDYICMSLEKYDKVMCGSNELSEETQIDNILLFNDFEDGKHENKDTTSSHTNIGQSLETTVSPIPKKLEISENELSNGSADIDQLFLVDFDEPIHENSHQLVKYGDIFHSSTTSSTTEKETKNIIDDIFSNCKMDRTVPVLQFSNNKNEEIDINEKDNHQVPVMKKRIDINESWMKQQLTDKIGTDSPISSLIATTSSYPTTATTTTNIINNGLNMMKTFPIPKNNIKEILSSDKSEIQFSKDEIFNSSHHIQSQKNVNFDDLDMTKLNLKMKDSIPIYERDDIRLLLIPATLKSNEMNDNISLNFTHLFLLHLSNLNTEYRIDNCEIVEVTPNKSMGVTYKICKSEIDSLPSFNPLQQPIAQTRLCFINTKEAKENFKFKLNLFFDFFNVEENEIERTVKEIVRVDHANLKLTSSKIN
ncbi:hypothetical protein SNEBB_000626 [Seison nebaliae]|nr:hypothetical protein SNEBB_000626 [Seison nebaliae]